MRIFLSYSILIVSLFISNKMESQEVFNNFVTADSRNFMLEKEVGPEQLHSLSFFEEDFNLISYTLENMRLGFNGFFEQDLPENDLTLTNFFLYNFGVSFTKNRFQISLFFENFFNLNNTNISIEPAYFASNNTLVFLEHDTPSMIHLSLVYSF